MLVLKAFHVEWDASSDFQRKVWEDAIRIIYTNSIQDCRKLVDKCMCVCLLSRLSTILLGKSF